MKETEKKKRGGREDKGRREKEKMVKSKQK